MAKQSVAQNDNGALSTVQALLPWYCSGPRPGLSSTSLARAIERRAFTCLPDELVDCVLQRYVDFVHPQLPIVDLDHLLTVFDGPRNGMKISLLLWQALGTATIPFLTESDLAKAGLVTAEASLRAFFHRTKILLDIDYETCRIKRLQACLLLCSRASHCPNIRTIQQSLWSEVIIVARAISAHDVKRDPKTKRHHDILPRRLWWTYLVLWNRLQFFDSRSSLEIFGETRMPNPLSLDDFEVNWLSSARCHTWYKRLGAMVGLERYLRHASFFCLKTATSVRLQSAQSSLRKASGTWTTTLSTLAPQVSMPLIDASLLAAKDLEDEFETYRAQHGLSEIPEKIVCSEQISTVVHWLDVSLYHRIATLELLRTEDDRRSDLNTSTPQSDVSIMSQKLRCGLIQQCTEHITQLFKVIISRGLSLVMHIVNGSLFSNIHATLKLLDTTISDLSQRQPKFDLTSLRVQRSTLYQWILKFHIQAFAKPTMLTYEKATLPTVCEETEDDVVSLVSAATSPESNPRTLADAEGSLHQSMSLPQETMSKDVPDRMEGMVLTVEEASAIEDLLNLESIIYAPTLN